MAVTDVANPNLIDDETLRRLRTLPAGGLVPDIPGPISPVMNARTPAAAATVPTITPRVGRKDATPGTSDLDIAERIDRSRPAAPADIPASSEALQPVGAAPEIGAQPPVNTGLQPIGGGSLKPLNFRERQALPQESAGAPVGSSAYDINKIQRIEDQRANPWGSAENHPGFWGKLGHVGAKIGNIAGDILDPNAMARIPGTELHRDLTEEATKEQLGKDQARELQEQEEKTREKHEENLADVNQQKADLALQKAQETREKDLRSKGLRLNQATGAVEGIPYEEMSPTEQAHIDLQTSQTDVANARAEYEKTKADPNSEANKNARQRLQTAAKNAATAAGRLGLEKNKYLADYLGLDETGKPLAGVQLDEKGNPIGPRVANAGATGAERLKRSDLAHNVRENGGAMIDLINNNPELFGKVAGRFTSFEQMIGSDDPAIAQLGMRGHNYALASNGMHGVRSQEAVHETEVNILNHFRNSPEATIAAIEAGVMSGDTFIKAAKMGKRPLPEETPGGARGAGKVNLAPGAEPPAPPGKTRVYDAQGTPHNVLSGSVNDFLKDPKYAGWSKTKPAAPAAAPP